MGLNSILRVHGKVSCGGICPLGFELSTQYFAPIFLNLFKDLTGSKVLIGIGLHVFMSVCVFVPCFKKEISTWCKTYHPCYGAPYGPAWSTLVGFLLASVSPILRKLWYYSVKPFYKAGKMNWSRMKPLYFTASVNEAILEELSEIWINTYAILQGGSLPAVWAQVQ